MRFVLNRKKSFKFVALPRISFESSFNSMISLGIVPLKSLRSANRKSMILLICFMNEFCLNLFHCGMENYLQRFKISSLEASPISEGIFPPTKLDPFSSLPFPCHITISLCQHILWHLNNYIIIHLRISKTFNAFVKPISVGKVPVKPLLAFIPISIKT